MAYRVLVVDDETDVLRIVHDAFLLDHFEVLTARDGLKAVELAQKYIPDLVVLDVMMPKMSGFQVCRMLRSSKELSDVRIIFLTAKDSDRDHDYGMRLGADEYIVKPFDPRDLVAKAQQILKDRQPKSGRVTWESESNVHWIT